MANITYKEAMRHWRMKRLSSMLKLRKQKKTLDYIGKMHGGLSRQRVYQILKDADLKSTGSPTR